MMLEPVLVTVEAPNTAKLCAEPSDGAVWADAGEAPYRSVTNPTLATRPRLLRVMMFSMVAVICRPLRTTGGR